MIALEERLAYAIASLILDPAQPVARHIAVGAASPIPAAACWLVRALGHPVRLSLLHKRTGNPFSEGSRELFDLAGQGRIDLFFLGGGEIDGQANINLVGTGDWPGIAARFPGSFGSAFMYMMVPRTILFRGGAFAAGAGESGGACQRPGGECAGGDAPRDGAGAGDGAVRIRVRGRAVPAGEPASRGGCGGGPAATGFDYDEAEGVPTTPDPPPEALAALRGPVRAAMLETYPAFCARVWPQDGCSQGEA